jgi:DNA-binding transcriptional LysR family regulator
MNLHELEAFVAVVETGSVGAAAARLRLTQPAVTRRLQALETDLGTRLLDRETRPPRLTADGRAVLDRARLLLRGIDDLRASVTPDAGPCGELRLGVTPGVSDLALGKPIGALRREFPQLALRLHSPWSNALLSDLRAGTVDAAAVLLPAGRTPPADLAGTSIGGDQVKVAASRRLRLPPRPRLADLAGQPWVLSPEGCYYHTSIGRAMTRANLPFQVAVDLFGPEQQLALVAEGIGLGLLPARVIARSRHRRALKTLDIVDFDLAVDLWVLHKPPLGRLAPAVECFSAALAEGLGAAGA